MSGLSIGEVATRVGLRASAIRYYEQVGLLPAPVRVSGRRSYDPAVFDRLALIAFARRAGFTIGETRRLVNGFPADAPASIRWRTLARQKERELQIIIERAQRMRQEVRAVRRCGCRTLDECGRRLRQRACPVQA